MRNKSLIHIVISWSLLIAFLLITKPEHLPVPLLIVPYVLFAVALYMTTRSIMNAYKPVSNNRKQRRNVLTMLVVATVVICIGLQSIGELAPRDLVIVALFSALAYFYMIRGRLQ